MKKCCGFLLISIMALNFASAQELKQVESPFLINQPTAGSLEKGEYGFDLRLFPDGGMLAALSAGLFERFMLGVSYGGLNFIGRGDPVWNELPGVLVKYRLIEETDFPALALGFDSQGLGAWSDSLDRYDTKALGLFAVLSKNFSLGWLGGLGIHGGVNYNTFEDKEDRSLNGFAGMDKSINDQFFLLMEYNLALDDNSSFSFGRNRGYLNAGVRWIFARQLGIEVNFKDILENRKDAASIGRELRITYVETL